MKLLFRLVLSLSMLLLPGSRHLHARIQPAEISAAQPGCNQEATGAFRGFENLNFRPAPYSSTQQPGFVSLSVDDEDEDESSFSQEKRVGVSYAAVHAQPRAPGIAGTSALSWSSFGKHFAYISCERFLLLRVIRR